MSTALLVGVGVAAALACPAHMWWQHRRGRQPACLMPTTEPNDSDQLQVLRERQRQLGARIAVAQEHSDQPTEQPGSPTRA